MEPGDILGHEFMGEVIEIGPEVKRLKIGDRVVVPLYHRLRAVLLLQKSTLVGLRQHQSQCLDDGDDVWMT